MKYSPRQAIGRVLISVLAGFLLAVTISEGAHVLLKEPGDRGPERIELVIPPGTAAKVAAGEAVPSIPQNMVFVQGDTLVVTNQDVAAHQLGPIWVPAGSSGSLSLDLVNQYSYSCSFQPNRYLDLDVRPQTNFQTRLTGIAMIGLPTAALFTVYSFVLFPGRKDLDVLEGDG